MKVEYIKNLFVLFLSITLIGNENLTIASQPTQNPGINCESECKKANGKAVFNKEDKNCKFSKYFGIDKDLDEKFDCCCRYK